VSATLQNFTINSIESH